MKEQKRVYAELRQEIDGSSKNAQNSAAKAQQESPPYDLNSRTNKAASTDQTSRNLGHKSQRSLLEEGEIRENKIRISLIGDRNTQRTVHDHKKQPAALHKIHENPILGRGGLMTSRWTTEQHIGELY